MSDKNEEKNKGEALCDIQLNEVTGGLWINRRPEDEEEEE